MGDSIQDLVRDAVNSKSALEAERAAIKASDTSHKEQVSTLRVQLEERVRALTEQHEREVAAMTAGLNKRKAALDVQTSLHAERVTQLAAALA